VNRAYVYWIDAFGGERLSWYSYADAGIITPFSNALDSCVNPAWSTVVAAAVQVGTGVPSSNPYPLVSDSAVLTFATSAGKTIGVLCPGFKESLYLADNQTVDPAQPLVAALIAAALAVPLVDSSGNPVSSYVSGLRQRRGY
jgi:hypothetical protein